MIWLTWRQHRAEAGVAAALLAVAVVALVAIGLRARHTADTLGLPNCVRTKADCGPLYEAVHRSYHSLPPVTGTLLVLPVLAAMFVAAPLISREYETGTHRLAWTQSVSRLRWMTVKVVLVVGILTAVALGLGLLAGWALEPLAPAFGTRFGGIWFEIQGFAPAAYMLFACALGIAASALLRRTIPAMALSLVVYFLTRFATHQPRKHFLPPKTHTANVPFGQYFKQAVTSTGSPAPPTGLSPYDWVLGTLEYDPTGNSSASGDIAGYCPGFNPRSPAPGSLHACVDKLDGLNARFVTSYQPAGRFWIFQAIESLIFVALAAALFGVAFAVVVRRRSV